MHLFKDLAQFPEKKKEKQQTHKPKMLQLFPLHIHWEAEIPQRMLFLKEKRKKATFHITYWFALLSAFILLFLLKIHFPDFFQILQDIVAF